MQSVQYSYEDFAKIPNFLFRLMGYDMLEAPSRTRLQRIMMQLYQALCLGSHGVCLGFMFFRLFEMKTIDSVSLIMRYATLVTYVVNSDTKYGTVLQRAAIQSLNNKLADLYPKTTLERIYYRVNDHFWSRTLLYLIRFYVGSSMMVVVGPMLTSFWVYFFHKQFSYMHCYPYFIFDPEKHSVWIYVGIYALEWLHSTQMVISNIATDMWLINFQVQICMHFRAMIKSIEDYQPRWENDVADRHFLSKIVDKHHYLVNLQTDLNSIFGSSLLLSLLSTASVLCTVSVYSLIQGLTLEGVTYVFFIGTSVVQMYFVCYHGQQVLDLSAYISNAVYNHNFHNASLSYKKFLLIIIIRSQKPVELNAMGYLPISLDTFKQASEIDLFGT
ncbi:hypothetical protein KR026_001876 [Drosophila bipectinata]|nr:hypothetical protein KR026_001876 [Drosophila bipectinata]